MAFFSPIIGMLFGGYLFCSSFPTLSVFSEKYINTERHMDIHAFEEAQAQN